MKKKKKKSTCPKQNKIEDIKRHRNKYWGEKKKNPLQHTGNLHTDPQQPRLMCSFDNWVDFLQIADHL